MQLFSMQRGRRPEGFHLQRYRKIQNLIETRNIFVITKGLRIFNDLSFYYLVNCIIVL